MQDRFEELIQKLAHVFHMPLHVDKNHGCALQIQKGPVVQLHSDIEQENLLVSCQIAELPAGKFRENVLREALKANGRPDPIPGIFAYITQHNLLFLFQRYPFDLLDGERVAGLIEPFLALCVSWKNAIEKGEMPGSESVGSSGSPFGIRP